MSVGDSESQTHRAVKGNKSRESDSTGYPMEVCA